MKGFFSFLIKHKYIVIVFFVALCIPAVMGMGLSKTSFDISVFMPKDANSIEGTRIEDSEFSTGAKAYVLLEDKENWQVLELKKRIESVAGVKSADWLDDVADIYTPEEFLSQKALEQFKKGGSTIMIVNFIAEEGDALVNSAISEISAFMQDGEYFSGSPVVVNSLKQMLKEEQPLYLIIAGGILVLLLAFSLSSFIAPVLCILNIGIAILLNYGTNFLFREQVSFMTASIAAVLQLAISMDFSIFLIHRFEEELKTVPGTGTAMVSAMRMTLVTISSSALTDCAGFIALIFMRNQIGADLGVVLCKGVVFSLITSLTLLPCLILATYGIGKKKHRSLIPSLGKASAPIIKVRYVLLALVLIVLVPSYFGYTRQEYYYTSDNFMPKDTAPIIALDKISVAFGTNDQVDVLYDKDMAAYEQTAMEDISKLGSVRLVTGLSDSAPIGVPESFLPEKLTDAYIGEQHRRFTVTLEGGLDNDALFSAVDGIRSTASGYLGDVYVAGSYAVAADMASTAKWDNTAVEIISIIFIFVILLIAFRSLLVPVFLVLVIKAAIYINVGINYFTGEEMIFLTPVFVGAIQLGATVDYAILFTSRYFEQRHMICDPKLAAAETIKVAVKPMLTSMLTFFFATLSITIISSVKATGEIATVVGRGALISFLVIMFALPALFILFDKPLMATTLQFRKKNRGIQAENKNEGMMV